MTGLTTAQLDSNLQGLSKMLGLTNPMESSADFVPVHLTHTFSSEYSPDGKTVEDRTNRILFTDKALLSSRERQVSKAGSLVSDDAFQAGLEDHVFSYLSVHDPFYGIGRGKSGRLLGVFIATPEPNYPKCHGSWRDLSSPQCSDHDPASLVLRPIEARHLNALEVKSSEFFESDFWKYWGAYDVWGNSAPPKDSWEWRYEFRFESTIPCLHWVALLYPVSPIGLAGGNRSIGRKDLRTIQRIRDEYPNISLVTYDWSLLMQKECFARASTIAARSYCDTGRFPQRISFPQGSL